MASAEATNVGMMVSFLCGYSLSDTKCHLKPPRVQKYLGILCDSGTASFRVPEDILRKLHGLIRVALDKDSLTGKAIETIARKCINMSVAIRLKSLLIRFMFAARRKDEICRSTPTQTYA